MKQSPQRVQRDKKSASAIAPGGRWIGNTAQGRGGAETA